MTTSKSEARATSAAAAGGPDGVAPTSVGENIVAENGAWSFAGTSAENFGTHVRRSIPFYEVGHELVCKASDYFVRDNATVYELGVSLGELLGALADHHAAKTNVSFTGIDIEGEMVRRARKRLATYNSVHVVQGDVATYEYVPADLIVSYYCIQFIPPSMRQHLIDVIYQNLQTGGGFLWFEKVSTQHVDHHDLITELYTDFKLEQCYLPAEIIAKSRSLKGVLVPYTSEDNRALLRCAGFTRVTTIFRYLCFEGILATK